MKDPKKPKSATAMRHEWQLEERRKRQEAQATQALLERKEGDGIYTGGELVTKEELQSDWQRLATLARIKFPLALAEKFDLTPKQRLCAVAWCLGWSIQKIADASELNRGTVSGYLNKNDLVQEFIKAFNYHNGGRDVKEVIDSEQYNSVCTIRDLRDDPSVSATTRLDAAKWLWETKHGKAKEAKEIRGVNLRELTEELSKLNIDEIAEEDVKKN